MFSRIANRFGTVWLDSGNALAYGGRFSILSTEPQWTFSATDQSWSISRCGTVVESGTSDPISRIEQLLLAHRALPPPTAPHLPFFGGLIGWISYDLGRRFESVPCLSLNDLYTNDICLSWYDNAIVWDHADKTTWIVAVEGERTAYAGVSELWKRINEDSRLPLVSSPHPCRAKSNMTALDYMARVDAIRGGIARGDYYQLNLVQRFQCKAPENLPATYLRLRRENPAPYAAYLDAGQTVVLSSSPESFIQLSSDGTIRTSPIKGTRPRGESELEDEAKRTELLASSKEKAELLMIVDLLRNDLGRISAPGTVAVDRLHAIQSFANVHHLVGEIRGQIIAGTTLRSLLRATFPGGSITGAPKVSAMRAIEHLEPHRRGIGMGSIGYFSSHGGIGLNIAIRTIICHRGSAYISVGAGIVSDSDPRAEYDETITKARPLFAALGIAGIAT